MNKSTGAPTHYPHFIQFTELYLFCTKTQQELHQGATCHEGPAAAFVLEEVWGSAAIESAERCRLLLTMRFSTQLSRSVTLCDLGGCSS